ncbi:MAG: ribosome-associated translation inhibitor RaiA [Myxococcaceae bacterium]|nr:ribosome-associated translation inhibitor RaiA [Myxococcaceae bacterium]
MKVNVRGVHLELTDAIKQHVQTHLIRPIERFFDDEAAELEIHLRDRNGPKGGADMECSVTVRLPHAATIHVTEVDDDLYKAIDLARDRLETASKRALERSQDRRRDEVPVGDLPPVR